MVGSFEARPIRLHPRWLGFFAGEAFGAIVLLALRDAKRWFVVQRRRYP